MVFKKNGSKHLFFYSVEATLSLDPSTSLSLSLSLQLLFILASLSLFLSPSLDFSL